MDLHTLLIRSADAGLEFLDDSEHMPAGHNGPYHDPETPVRNTAHWSITFLKAYQITDDDKYRDAATKCISYLLSDEVRPYGETFRHRKTKKKDACNGLIGQAWTIEALATVGGSLNWSEPLELAKSTFLRHPFDETLAAWKVVDIDGTIRGYDLTLNHQIWFAAAGALILEHAEVTESVKKQVRKFLDELNNNMYIYQSGIIYHNVRPKVDFRKYHKLSIENTKRRRIPMPIIEVIRPETKLDLKQKSIGYQSFNLYALALIYQLYPELDLWNSNEVTSSLDYSRTNSFKNSLENNEFAYPYNCTGIEMSYVNHVFNGKQSEIRAWLSTQFNRSYDLDSGLMRNETEDVETLSARLYEATRLPNIDRIFNQ